MSCLVLTLNLDVLPPCRDGLTFSGELQVILFIVHCTVPVSYNPVVLRMGSGDLQGSMSYILYFKLSLDEITAHYYHGYVYCLVLIGIILFDWSLEFNVQYVN